MLQVPWLSDQLIALPQLTINVTTDYLSNWTIFHFDFDSCFSYQYNFNNVYPSMLVNCCIS